MRCPLSPPECNTSARRAPARSAPPARARTRPPALAKAENRGEKTASRITKAEERTHVEWERRHDK